MCRKRWTNIGPPLGQCIMFTGPHTVRTTMGKGQWADLPAYDNVIFMMGDLHVTFNFLKAIGQHMENSGLDDIWVEPSVFANKST